jgi:hypothetical protein
MSQVRQKVSLHVKEKEIEGKRRKHIGKKKKLWNKESSSILERLDV